MKWEKVKLGELYTVHNGLSKSRDFFGSGFPFLSFSTVFNNYFIPEQLSDLVQTNEKEQRSYSILRGDVFVTRTSETADELGISCVALKDYPHATYNGFTKRMRPIDVERISPKYIGYYMRWERFRAEFQAFSTMTTRASLRNEELLGLEIALPPIEIQEKIGNVLHAYDKLIENNQRQIKLLEEAAQRLYKEWFVDFRFPGHESTPITNGIPEGWEKGILGDVANFKRGKVITKEQAVVGDIPVVAGGLEPAYYHNQFNAISPVITVSGSGANAGFTRLYHTNIWASDCSFVDSETTKSIYFIYCLLKSKTDDLILLRKGSAQPHVYAKDVNALEINLPPAEVLGQFEKFVSSYFEKTRVLLNEIEKLREARDRLLPKLMSGEIEVVG